MSNQIYLKVLYNALTCKCHYFKFDFFSQDKRKKNEISNLFNYFYTKWRYIENLFIENQ